MSRMIKVLSILDLFDSGKTQWLAEDIAKQMKLSKPTGYRYLKELCDSGLLAKQPGGAYILGPKIIEMDYQIRLTDPMISAGKSVLQELVNKTGCDVLLSSMYNDRVLIIHEEAVPMRNRSVSRGKLVPLFKGSTSKIILANLSRNHLGRIYEDHSGAIAEAGLGGNVNEFRAQLSVLKKQGYCIAHEELDPGITGISAPIFEASQVRGSLTLGMPTERFSLYDQNKLIELVTDAAKRIEAYYHIDYV